MQRGSKALPPEHRPDRLLPERKVPPQMQRDRKVLLPAHRLDRLPQEPHVRRACRAVWVA